MYVKPQRPQPGRATRPQPATYSCSCTTKTAMQAVQPAGPACILQARALVCRREHGMHAKIRKFVYCRRDTVKVQSESHDACMLCMFVRARPAAQAEDRPRPVQAAGPLAPACRRKHGMHANILKCSNRMMLACSACLCEPGLRPKRRHGRGRFRLRGRWRHLLQAAAGSCTAEAICTSMIFRNASNTLAMKSCSMHACMLCMLRWARPVSQAAVWARPAGACIHVYIYG